MEGDEARIRRVLSELLRGQGLSKAQRISVQLKALLSLVQSLRCATVTDELTGLCNQRGFVQTGTRLLDVAARDGSAAHLVCFEVNDLARVIEAMGPTAADVLLRQMGNFMRDLYPSYGVYEVLGRLEGAEFAALTTNPEYASRGALMLRVRRPQQPGSDLPPLSLRVGVAHFNPRRPVGMQPRPRRPDYPPNRCDAYLTASRRRTRCDLRESERVGLFAATEGSAPMDGGMPGWQPGLRDSDGVRLSVFRNHVPRLRG
ncbi:MAG: diguanylate cyclase, partial [Gammaproteobacteria bacterium]